MTLPMTHHDAHEEPVLARRSCVRGEIGRERRVRRGGGGEAERALDDARRHVTVDARRHDDDARARGARTNAIVERARRLNGAAAADERHHVDGVHLTRGHDAIEVLRHEAFARATKDVDAARCRRLTQAHEIDDANGAVLERLGAAGAREHDDARLRERVAVAMHAGRRSAKHDDEHTRRARRRRREHRLERQRGTTRSRLQGAGEREDVSARLVASELRA